MKKHLTADKILQLFEPPYAYFPQFILRKQASVKEMILALEKTDSLRARRTICAVLGDRHAKSAVDILVRHLADSDLTVRIYSAESLGKIGDAKAGPALLALFNEKQPHSFSSTLALAMGPIHYQPALPRLIRALTDDNDSVRGCAAWSLGLLLAPESIPALEQALKAEKDSWAKSQIQNALDTITKSLKQSD
ncbi:MAG: HEAT repeat domain-containing protein [Anaerolineae bacterium]|nr:HEAT repeat domain-containing protein [Anaerolineae bacterium]